MAEHKGKKEKWCAWGIWVSREGTRGYGRMAREYDGVENNVAGRDKDTAIRGAGEMGRAM